MWQISSNDSAVAPGSLMLKKLTPFFFSSDPSVTPAHYSALSIVFLSLSEFFFDKLVLWKTKWKGCLGLIHFLPSSMPPPSRRRHRHPDNNDRLCASQAAVILMFLSWKQACDSSYCHIRVWHSRTLLRSSSYSSQSSLIGIPLAFLASARRREAMFSPTLRGWAGGHALPFSVSSLLPPLRFYMAMHHCHSNNSLPQPTERGEGRSWLPTKLANILARVRYIHFGQGGCNQSVLGCGYVMKCSNFSAKEKKEKNQEKEREDLFPPSSLPVRGGGALRLMPAIRLCVANEERARHTH